MRILLLPDRVVCDARPTRGADGAAGLSALPDSPVAGPATSEADSLVGSPFPSRLRQLRLMQVDPPLWGMHTAETPVQGP